MADAVCPLCHAPVPGPPVIAGREEGAEASGKALDCSSLGHHSHNDVYRCRACDTGFLWPLPEAAELEQAYADVVDDVYLEEKAARYRTFRHALSVLQRFVGGGSLLEIGSYCGFFMDVAREGGFSPTGMEPSRWAAEHARRELGLEAIDAPFTKESVERELSGRRFDCVVSWDVLEHVADPGGFVELAEGLLAPGGVFAFSTLNVDNWWAKLLGKRWPWYMQMHLYYFTLGGLRRMLDERGLELVHHEAYRHIISGTYLLRKLEALSGLPFRAPGPLRRLFDRVFVPFYFGDIVLVIARRKGETSR